MVCFPTTPLFLLCAYVYIKHFLTCSCIDHKLLSTIREALSFIVGHWWRYRLLIILQQPLTFLSQWAISDPHWWIWVQFNGDTYNHHPKAHIGRETTSGLGYTIWLTEGLCRDQWCNQAHPRCLTVGPYEPRCHTQPCHVVARIGLEVNLRWCLWPQLLTSHEPINRPWKPTTDR